MLNYNDVLQELSSIRRDIEFDCMEVLANDDGSSVFADVADALRTVVRELCAAAGDLEDAMHDVELVCALFEGA